MKHDGQLKFSPTDLIVFFESPFASFMDRCACDEPAVYPADREKDPQLELIAAAGTKHELAYLEKLRASGVDLCEIERGAKAADTTEAAIRAGRGVIFQAALRRGRFFGYADFLVRVDRPGTKLGYTYRVADTKLARKAKPYFLLQLCCYAEMLEPILGHRPDELEVITGDNEPTMFRTDEFFFYYESVRDAFLQAQDTHDAAKRPMPEVGVDHRHWSELAEQIFDDVDHPCRVANITKHQIKRLANAGIETFTQLADTSKKQIPRMAQPTFHKLRGQARLQRDSNGAHPPKWELLTHEERGDKLGLALLPAASPNDLFFDMEGYPLVDGGLEYLFGVTHVKKGKRAFEDFWAYSPEEERATFERFVDWVYERWRKDGALHVYHYAPYEVTALKRLMGKYGTREHEVDEMLRGEVFVDLYRIVRQAIRVGEPRYSLKNVEKLYRKPREGDVANAGDSIVEFARWMEERDGHDWKTSKILGAIRDYNRDDCDSTCELATWLRERQREAGARYAR